MSWSLRFLGVGNAQAAPELGSAGAVLERAGEPVLMIDCGQEALSAFLDRYGTPPRAVYITHAHMDHVGGLERLFYKIYFDARLRGQVRLYMHAALVPVLQSRVADYPEVIAEGGANFWDAFALIPVSRGFWHDAAFARVLPGKSGRPDRAPQPVWFDVFPTRHHAPGTSFGIALPGSFVWTGDTRPIPEMLAHYAEHGEIVAHDCALHGNPSHTGVDDLAREYSEELRRRLMLYHYGSHAEAAELVRLGYRVARPGEVIAVPAPRPLATAQEAVGG